MSDLPQFSTEVQHRSVAPAPVDTAAYQRMDVHRPITDTADTGAPAPDQCADLGPLPASRTPEDKTYPRPTAAHAAGSLGARAVEVPAANGDTPGPAPNDGQPPAGPAPHTPARPDSTPAESTAPDAASGGGPGKPPDRGGPPPASGSGDHMPNDPRPDSLVLFDMHAAEAQPTAQEVADAIEARGSFTAFADLLGQVFGHPDIDGIYYRTERSGEVAQAILDRNRADPTATMPLIHEVVMRAELAAIYATSAAGRPVVAVERTERPAASSSVTIDLSNTPGDSSTIEITSTGGGTPVLGMGKAEGHIGPDGRWTFVNTDITQRQSGRTVDGRQVVTTETFVGLPPDTEQFLTTLIADLRLFGFHVGRPDTPIPPSENPADYLIPRIVDYCVGRPADLDNAGETPALNVRTLREHIERYTRAVEAAAARAQEVSDSQHPAHDHFTELAAGPQPDLPEDLSNARAITDWLTFVGAGSVTPITPSVFSGMDRRAIMSPAAARAAVDGQFVDLERTMALISHGALGLATIRSYVEGMANYPVLDTIPQTPLAPGETSQIGRYTVMAVEGGEPLFFLTGRSGQGEFELYRGDGVAYLTHPQGTERFIIRRTGQQVDITGQRLVSTAGIDTAHLAELETAYTQYYELLGTASTPGADINALRPQLEARTAQLFKLINGDDPAVPPPEGRTTHRVPLQAHLLDLYDYATALLNQPTADTAD